jgi:argininosuccinate lyase
VTFFFKKKGDKKVEKMMLAKTTTSITSITPSSSSSSSSSSVRRTSQQRYPQNLSQSRISRRTRVISSSSSPLKILLKNKSSSLSSSAVVVGGFSNNATTFSSSSSSFNGKKMKNATNKNNKRGRELAATNAAAASGEPKKLWGGAFSEKIDPLMEKFNESLSFDRRMALEDIEGSIGYASALARTGIITEEEKNEIHKGLKIVLEEWQSGSFVAKEGDEDIHTANERRLCEVIDSNIGGKLHTGRSRNDQVATDTRMWLRKELTVLRKYLRTLIEVAIDRAEKEVDHVMPGFTHLQSAQTVRFSHWLLSHAAAWQRDDMRLNDLMPRVNTMPLGSGALAGNPFGVDRQLLAKDLNFERVCPNSMDAVSDRDFVIETMFWASMTLMHISRWSEDLIVYSSQQFGMMQMSDAYSTGSSLMPQKKNPDALELLRGKAGRQIGTLTGLLCILKGTPTTYNKDFQEGWLGMFETVDTMSDCLQIAAGCLATMKLNPEKMKSSLVAEMLATDLAEYLVRKGMPFRETHHISGAAVKLAVDKKVPLDQLTVDDLKPLCDKFEDDVAEIWSYEKSAESRDTEGGTSRRSVLEQCAKLRAYLKETEL